MERVKLDTLIKGFAANVLQGSLEHAAIKVDTELSRGIYDIEW